MKKRVLIVGSKGMAGHILYGYLKQLPAYEVFDIARDDSFFPTVYKLDVTDLGALSAAIADCKPDVIVNCIGILNADAENNPDKAILLNSYLPHFLAKAVNAIGGKLIHISTDCVFNGKKGNYREDDVKDGIGFYAQSKALGEVDYDQNLTIRTSIIGPELKENGIGLFQWFTKQHGEIKGYTNAFWTGVTTVELAKAIAAAIEQDITGLHHLVYYEKISKYDLIDLFKQVFKRNDIKISRFNNYYSDKSLVNDDVSFNYKAPSYRQMLEEMKLWIDQHSSFYNLNNH